MSISAFIKRHPITTYYALVLAISWGGLLVVAGPGGITAEQTETPFIVVYLVTVAGPSVAGILLTSLIETPRSCCRSLEFITTVILLRMNTPHLPSRPRKVYI